jgi:hypothetical protein
MGLGHPIACLFLLYALQRHYSWFGKWLERSLDQHPTIIVVALVTAFGPLVVVGWMERDWRKNREAYAASAMKKRAETIQAMQDISYWSDGATRTNVPSGAASGDVMTMACWLARKRVEKEIKSKGFMPSQVPLSEINKAGRALLAAQPLLIEQARARLGEIRGRGLQT